MRLTMWGRYLFLYPLFASIGTIVTFLISYGISVSQDHIAPFVPFVRSIILVFATSSCITFAKSYTGAWPPESCVFGQLLNFSALLIGITMYIRYRQIDEELTTSCPFGEQLRKITHRLNITSLIFAILITISLSIVANFQNFAFKPIHLTGAGGVFLIGALYLSIDTWFTFKLVSLQTRPIIKYIRATLTGLLIINCVIIFVGILISDSKYTGEENDKLKWSANNGGFAEHLMAAIGQWIASSAIVLYIATLVSDFRKIGLMSPELYTLTKNYDVQDVKHETYVNHVSDVNHEIH